jgi:hypothetical protein
VKKLLAVSATLIFLCCGLLQGENRIVLVPRLQAGQMIRFESRASIMRKAKTESKVVSAGEPKAVKVEIAEILNVTIIDVQLQNGRPIVKAHVDLEQKGEQKGESSTEAGAAKKVALDFTISDTGQISKIKGLEDLDSAQRLVWQFWLAQFAFGWTLPATGVKPGEKWKTEEAETTASPIAGLGWEREINYVRDDACPLMAKENCAVFLTDAKLTQKSSEKDTTPEDYKLHDLRTSGTAGGTNETISYYALPTGILMRATEDEKQSMDVTILKADETNGVHYNIDVTSHFETVFLPTAVTAQP